MIGQLVNNYKIVKEIDAGGMGTVYLGKHITLDIKVAIKRLHPHLTKDENIKKRFLQEAATQSKLEHQSITKILDYINNDNGHFIILEFIEGIPLSKYIFEEKGLLPEEEANQMIIKILDAVGYAHKNKVVHRDLKPSNIMVLPNKDIKILDFGIAKIMGNDISLTQTGTKLGSPLYMSPEQVLGRKVDHRSDIYSLGVLYYEMLTGNPVYNQQNTTQFQIYNKIVKEPLPRVKEIYPHTSNIAQEIIDKATNKTPENRFSTCEQFTNALNHGNISENTIIKESILFSKKDEKDFNPLALILTFSFLLIGSILFIKLFSGNEATHEDTNQIAITVTNAQQTIQEPPEVEDDIITNYKVYLKESVKLRKLPNDNSDSSIILRGYEITNKGKIPLHKIEIESLKKLKQLSIVEKGCGESPQQEYWHFVSLNKDNKKYQGWMWGGCLSKNPVYPIERQVQPKPSLQKPKLTKEQLAIKKARKKYAKTQDSFFNGRLGVIQSNGNCGYIDINGNVVIPIKYRNCNRFYQWKAQVNEGRRNVTLDIYGNEINE